MFSTEQSAILHRTLDKEYPTAVEGQGVFLATSDGRKVLDGSSGAAVSCLGHGNLEVIESICTQARKLPFAHTSFFTSDPAEELARLLLSKSNNAFSKVVFLTSGSEAVESALKLARQYHVYMNQPDRIHVVGRSYSYHGNTLGALAAGYHPARRATFTPILSETFHHVSRCFYPEDAQDRAEEAYEDSLIAEYEAKFQQLGPSTVAAVIVEPIVGATLGSVSATKGYLPKLKALCERHGILTIYDEVMCGMGRSGTYHAWQSLGNVAPDLQTIGKGLCAGYQPLSAVLLGANVARVFGEHSRGPTVFLSGHTFQGHSIACAAAITVQNILFRDNLIDRCLELGQILRQTLDTGLPSAWREWDGALRGLGLFQTLDFGSMGQHITGGPLAAEVSRRSFELGAAVYLCSSAVDAILFCPPFTATENEMRLLANIVLKAFKEVYDERLARRQTLTSLAVAANSKLLE